MFVICFVQQLSEAYHRFVEVFELGKNRAVSWSSVYDIRVSRKTSSMCLTITLVFAGLMFNLETVSLNGENPIE